jgi:hypothetical protein
VVERERVLAIQGSSWPILGKECSRGIEADARVAGRCHRMVTSVSHAVMGATNRAALVTTAMSPPLPTLGSIVVRLERMIGLADAGRATVARTSRMPRGSTRMRTSSARIHIFEMHDACRSARMHGAPSPRGAFVLKPGSSRN